MLQSKGSQKLDTTELLNNNIFFSTIFFNHCAVVTNLLANSGDATDGGSIPGSGRLLEKEMAIHSIILA